jgi:hypothetical protein
MGTYLFKTAKKIGGNQQLSTNWSGIKPYPK